MRDAKKLGSSTKIILKKINYQNTIGSDLFTKIDDFDHVSTLLGSWFRHVAYDVKTQVEIVNSGVKSSVEPAILSRRLHVAVDLDRKCGFNLRFH